jgi:hypothetical protein
MINTKVPPPPPPCRPDGTVEAVLPVSANDDPQLSSGVQAEHRLDRGTFASVIEC